MGPLGRQIAAELAFTRHQGPKRIGHKRHFSLPSEHKTFAVQDCRNGLARRKSGGLDRCGGHVRIVTPVGECCRKRQARCRETSRRITASALPTARSSKR
jgi:hypothetical protein